jgi:hypothetical protein
MRETLLNSWAVGFYPLRGIHSKKFVLHLLWGDLATGSRFVPGSDGADDGEDRGEEDAAEVASDIFLALPPPFIVRRCSI